MYAAFTLAEALGLAGALSLIVAAVTAAYFNARSKSKEDQIAAWKGLAEARKEETLDLRRDVDDLRARVKVLEGEWFRDVAEGIVRALPDAFEKIRTAEERRHHGL